MILLDFNQVMVSNLMQSLDANRHFDEALLRHMVLNGIRSLNQKFKSEYGELVICADDTRNWRRDVYPYYKANRKKSRDSDSLDWNAVFTFFNSIRSDLREHFPYRVIQVDRAEADDVIGTIVHRHNTGDPILILSGDKDFVQLQVYDNVRQYDMIHKRWITTNDPEAHLFEHIIRGDSGDGIPNILSDDDVFLIDGKRQRPITAKRLREFRDNINSMQDDDPAVINFNRNKTLIDLSMVAPDIASKISDEFSKPNDKTRSGIFNYLMSHKLTRLMDSLHHF